MIRLTTSRRRIRKLVTTRLAGLPKIRLFIWPISLLPMRRTPAAAFCWNWPKTTSWPAIALSISTSAWSGGFCRSSSMVMT